MLFGRAPWVKPNILNVMDGSAMSRMSYFILFVVVLLAVQTSPGPFVLVAVVPVIFVQSSWSW
jgi:hypothetical protein